MLDKLKELFTQEVSSENIVLLLILIGVGLLAIFFFYILVKACFMVEKQSGRPAHNIIKTAIIELYRTFPAGREIVYKNRLRCHHPMHDPGH